MSKLLKLQYLRKRKGYNQKDMAELLGVSPSHYSQIERGLRRMPLEMAKEIKRLLDVNYIEDLFDDAV